MPSDPDRPIPSPETARLLGYPPTDSAGRTYPRRLRWATFFATSQFGPMFREAFQQEIPPDFWNVDVAEDGETPVVLVACPCGETPVVELCSVTECDCGRFYLNTGKRVRVCRPEGVEAGLPTR